MADVLTYDGKTYTVVGKGSSPGNIAAVGGYSDLPAGSNVLVRIHLKSYTIPWLTSHLFDVAGIGEKLGKQLAPAHMKVSDVYESGGHVYIKGTVTGSPLIPILLAVGVALTGAAFLIATIEIGSDMPKVITSVSDAFSDVAKAVPWILGAVAVIMIVPPLLGKKVKNDIY